MVTEKKTKIGQQELHFKRAPKTLCTNVVLYLSDEFIGSKRQQNLLTEWRAKVAEVPVNLFIASIDIKKYKFSLWRNKN